MSVMLAFGGEGCPVGEIFGGANVWTLLLLGSMTRHVATMTTAICVIPPRHINPPRLTTNHCSHSARIS